jgi:hypothetical protein
MLRSSWNESFLFFFKVLALWSLTTFTKAASLKNPFSLHFRMVSLVYCSCNFRKQHFSWKKTRTLICSYLSQKQFLSSGNGKNFKPFLVRLSASSYFARFKVFHQPVLHPSQKGWVPVNRCNLVSKTTLFVRIFASVRTFLNTKYIGNECQIVSKQPL